MDEQLLQFKNKINEAKTIEEKIDFASDELCNEWHTVEHHEYIKCVLRELINSITL